VSAGVASCSCVIGACGGAGGRNWCHLCVSNPQVRLEFRQKVSLLLCTSSNFYKGTVEWRLQAIVPNLVPNVLL